MTYVKMMMLVTSLVWSLFGWTPSWCDCCGELYHAEQMTESSIGAVCPECVEFSTEMGWIR